MIRMFSLVVCVLLTCAATANGVTIETVPIANSEPGFGAYQVDYSYNIGKYEVTNAQYTEFLNAKAQSNVLDLFTIEMGNSYRAGIARSGTNGNYSYATRPNMANKPVNFVSWLDAARFVNWLHNGQGDGDTEDGAYRLTGDVVADGTVTRNANARWALPTSAEWLKAGHFDPQAGVAWNYPTGSNAIPAVARADGFGNIRNPGFVANYAMGAEWNGVRGNVTTVGSGGPLSASAYGTYDQAGNIGEWGETYNNEDPVRPRRQAHGGNYLYPFASMQSSAYLDLNNHADSEFTGFRVVQLMPVPEPSSLFLATIGACALLLAARRRALG